MTVLSLSLWIAAAVCLQLALWLSISFWRHWQEYRQLRWHTRDQTLPPSPAQPMATPGSSAAWNGYRSFRVERKEFEDGLQSVCSFYLVPEDGKPLFFAVGRRRAWAQAIFTTRWPSAASCRCARHPGISISIKAMRRWC